MKRKIKLLKAPRNPMVARILFKKSGPHGKTEKATRRQQKIDDRKNNG